MSRFLRRRSFAKFQVLKCISFENYFFLAGTDYVIVKEGEIRVGDPIYLEQLA